MDVATSVVDSDSHLRNPEAANTTSSSNGPEQSADVTQPQTSMMAHLAHVASTDRNTEDPHPDASDGEDDDGDENQDNVTRSPASRQGPVDPLRALAMRREKRETDPKLPETVTVLETLDGGKVYIVGTAHFSKESQEDVAKTIEATQPDAVVLELCCSRINILQYDEETLLEEAKDLSIDKMKRAIQQSGVIQGVLHLLLLNMSAHLTKELGMAPGGEFRRAVKEAMKVPGCQVHLGDRPIDATLRRALGALSAWQKLKFAYSILTNKDSITKEEVERLKQKDLLEEMLKEITGEFPQLSRVFVTERDMYLARSLKFAAKPIPCPENEAEGLVPTVTVGVVGIGHVAGIKEHWNRDDYNIKELLKIPPPSMLGIASKYIVRATLVGLLAYGGYKLYRLGSYIVVSTSQRIAKMS